MVVRFVGEKSSVVELVVECIDGKEESGPYELIGERPVVQQQAEGIVVGIEVLWLRVEAIEEVVEVPI